MTIETGSPEGALILFSLYATVGLIVGGVIFGLFAFRGSRRPQFRQWGTMPRTGAVCGLIVATGIIYIAWHTGYRGFFKMEIDGETVRLEYRMPTQSTEIPLENIVGFEEQFSYDKGGNRRLLVETESGSYISAQMYRSDFRRVWETLEPYRKP